MNDFYTWFSLIILKEKSPSMLISFDKNAYLSIII